MHEIMGMQLPPRHVTDYLVNRYFDSVHWFMMIFHKPSFMANYHRAMSTRMVPRSEIGFIVLLMMVLAMGGEKAIQRGHNWMSAS